MYYGLRAYRKVQRGLLEQWFRIGFFTNESFDAYIKRSYAERLLLHDVKAEFNEEYQQVDTPKNLRKMGV